MDVAGRAPPYNIFQEVARWRGKSISSNTRIKELSKLVEREGTLSDWDKAASMTQAEIEACVASDSDEAEMVMDWDNVTVELPPPKAVLNMRIDKDILDYFRKTGRGYQSLINAVLRSYVAKVKAGVRS